MTKPGEPQPPTRKSLITDLEYVALFQRQDGLCAICGKQETTVSKFGNLHALGVDHCHVTNVIRGLLCHRCNRGLGQFQHDTRLLMTAVRYLDATNPPTSPR